MAVPQIGEKYRHFRGRTYVVLGVGKMEGTAEEVVIYQSTHPGDPKDVWVRPLSEWSQDVTITTPRFELVHGA